MGKQASGWTRALIVAALSGAAASCGGGGDNTDSAPPVVSPPLTPAPVPAPTPAPTPVASYEREIEPAAADARVTSFFQPHVAINPSATVNAKGRLFVMLPGTGGPARAYRFIVREATQQGYHAISLTYPNQPAVNDLCPRSAETNCAESVRREIIFGTDESAEVSVGAADSITGRLFALLALLARNAPAEGWGAYMIDGAPDWSRIRLAGHSQGAGHAGLLAKLVLLDRVGFFSGPGDLGEGGRGLAPWLSLPNRTPADRIYGLIHRDDDAVPVNFALLQWRAMGLASLGQPAEVDGLSAYAGGSHQLVTTVSPRATDLPLSPLHGAPVVDVVTLLTVEGEPQMASVWRYMLF